MRALPNTNLGVAPGLDRGLTTGLAHLHCTAFSHSQRHSQHEGGRRALPQPALFAAPSSQVSGTLAGFISSGSHLTLIRMVRFLLFPLPDVSAALLGFLNKKKDQEERGWRRQMLE